MSDCSNTAGYDVLRLQADFEGQEFPWMYPLALNGRRLMRLTANGPLPQRFELSVNGVRYVPARGRDWDGEDE